MADQISYTEWASDCKHEVRMGPPVFQLWETQGRESAGRSAYLAFPLVMGWHEMWTLFLHFLESTGHRAASWQ